MIVDLLTLTRPFIVFDLETTGLGFDARIVEIGFHVYTSEGKSQEWRSLINPEMPIPPETTAIHGITDAEVVDAFTWRQVAPNIARGFSNCDFGGKNIRFDLGKVSEEMARVGVEWSYAGARIICADRLEQIAEPRDLSSLYTRRTGKEPLDAHSAMDDVQMTVEVLDAQFRTFVSLPRDLDELHKLQWPGWVDSEGKFKMIDGVPTCNFGKKYKGQDMRTIPKSYYQWMLGENFCAEVKTICADAVAGRFPG